MTGTDGDAALRPVVERARPDPSTPLLLTGLAAAAILSADGELRAPRETRGGTVEWGGAYAQGVRLTGPWTVSGEVDGTSYDLPGTLESLVAYRWRVETTHSWGMVHVRQTVVPHPSEPGVIRTLELSSARPARVRLEHRIEPFLAPVLVEGIKPYEYRVVARGEGLEARAFGCAGAFVPLVAPTGWTIDGTPWHGQEVKGEIRSIGIRRELDVGPDVRTDSVLAWGGVAATVDHGPDLASPPLPSETDWARSADYEWSSWAAGTPTMDLPDSPRLAAAYDLARAALRSLYTRPNSEITGLVAGYPWYPALWCRDLAWMLPAVLWLGDRGWAETSIRTAFRFQATARIPLLGAEVGELPMQVSPGPVFLYGTSDTTLYYPDLVRRLLDHGGPVRAASELWPHLRAVADWARAKTDPTTGLVANGGEVAELRDATARVGSIHYGFDAVDTTIWDSTDRRDHAVDIQVHAFRAYRALATLGERLGLAGNIADDSASADRLAEGVAARYLWPEEAYLVDSLRRDGSPVAKVRPNALLAVSAGLLPPATARAAVSRALADDLATPWGIRTLSSRDPGYDPQAYHDGQVWTIATAWAAEAAFEVGDPEAGVRLLGTIADRLLAENGLANECYHGDRAEPYDSCFLLGFSVAPFLTAMFERLWGLRVSSEPAALAVEPAFPTGWHAAKLRRLSVAGGWVDLDWTKERLSVDWSGPGPLRVTQRGRSFDLVGPGTARIDTAAP